jgi:hypothetical protein
MTREPKSSALPSDADADADAGAAAAAVVVPAEPAVPAVRRFRPPSRRTFVAMLGAAVASVALRDRLTGREVIRNPATGKPIWIGHV